MPKTACFVAVAVVGDDLLVVVEWMHVERLKEIDIGSFSRHKLAVVAHYVTIDICSYFITKGNGLKLVAEQSPMNRRWFADSEVSAIDQGVAAQHLWSPLPPLPGDLKLKSVYFHTGSDVTVERDAALTYRIKPAIQHMGLYAHFQSILKHFASPQQ